MKGLNFKMNAPALAARIPRVRTAQNFNTARYAQLQCLEKAGRQARCVQCKADARA